MPDFDPQFLAYLLGAIGAMLWIYNQAMVATGKRKAEQPFVISMEKRFVSQEDHREHRDAVMAKFKTVEGRIERNHEATEARFRELDRASSEGREKIYNRINAIGEEVAAQRKADEMTQATLARMDQKLDALNNRKADKS